MGKLFSRCGSILSAPAEMGVGMRGLAMDLFEKKRFLLPIEVVIVLSINLVVAVLCCYAVMMWDF